MTIVWSPIYNIYIDSLENIHRRFLKSLHYQFLRLPQDVLVEIFSADSLVKRRLINSQLLLFKLLNNVFYCTDLAAKIQILVPRLHSRNSNFLVTPTYRTNLLCKSLEFQMMENYKLYLKTEIDFFSTSLDKKKTSRAICLCLELLLFVIFCMVVILSIFYAWLLFCLWLFLYLCLSL